MMTERIIKILNRFNVTARDYAQLVAELDDLFGKEQLEIKKGWHDVVIECERILGLEGTAESPITSNLPNALRDIIISKME